MNTDFKPLETDTLDQEQLACYNELKLLLGLQTDIPYTKDWSASPDFLLKIAQDCLTEKPSTIVECSSGTSTLILAKCCEINRHGKVFSLEHEKLFANQTEAYLQHYSLVEYSDVIYAPLTEYTLDDKPYSWYDLNGFSSNNIDMLVIDGPPGFIQKHSRYPALPLLYDRLSNHCRIYMDDASRPDEQEIIRVWREEWPYSHDCQSQLEYIHEALDRGCAILKSRID